LFEFKRDFFSITPGTANITGFTRFLSASLLEFQKNRILAMPYDLW